MPIITFVKEAKEESGKSLAVAAIGTSTAIQNDAKILLISTTNRTDNLLKCFFQKTKRSKSALKFVSKIDTLDTEEDVIAMARMLKSNKLDKDNIANFVRSVFKDRLDVLGGVEAIEKIDESIIASAETEAERNHYLEQQKRIEERNEVSETLIGLYPKIIGEASKNYDYVFVDLDNNIKGEAREQILEASTVIVHSMIQKMENIENTSEKIKLGTDSQKNKSMILLSRYDRKSKLNSKNISRYVGKKLPVITMPYNTLFFDSAQEAGIAGLLLKLSGANTGYEERNHLFMEETKNASNSIMNKIQELQIQY